MRRESVDVRTVHARGRSEGGVPLTIGPLVFRHDMLGSRFNAHSKILVGFHDA